MTTRTAEAVAVCLLASATLVAADFWEQKDYTAWSEREVAQMLTDSPWARKSVILNADLSLAHRVGGLSGGVVGRGVGSRGAFGGTGGGVGGDAAGTLGGGSFLPSPERINIAVRWSSALPVRQAAARRQFLVNAIAVPESLPPAEPVYRISVVGLPPYAFPTGELADATTLNRDNAAPIQPASIHFTYEGELLTIDFHFSKADPITPDHKEVEFVTTLGGTTVKKKFNLRDMMFRGGLAL